MALNQAKGDFFSLMKAESADRGDSDRKERLDKHEAEEREEGAARSAAVKQRVKAGINPFKAELMDRKSGNAENRRKHQAALAERIEITLKKVDNRRKNESEERAVGEGGGSIKRRHNKKSKRSRNKKSKRRRNKKSSRRSRRSRTRRSSR